ncbi:MAG: autotransporter-associated beta strand repeat-containing protein [Verrucomicrobiae bacterium]|nr:autotransporter-associated beta strand repeat-containing protein [Verrucomicrobiae bacterium]
MRHFRPMQTAAWNTLFFTGIFLLAGMTAPAAVIYQTVNQSGADANGWSSAIWGTPAAVATGGNTYFTTNTFFVRTPNVATASTFAGSSLTLSNGTLYLKHNNGVATVNLVLNPGTITYHGGPGGSNSPIAGTLQVLTNSTFTTDQGVATRDIGLLSTLSGSGNLTVAMITQTNALIVSGTNTAYTGNWTNTSGVLQIASGTTNALGSGNVTLNSGTSLTFNTTNNLVVNNLIGGAGSVIKQNTGTVLLGANNVWTGNLSVQGGLLALTGTGTQNVTTISTNGVLLIANSAALPSPSTLTISPNNAQTGGIQLSNNITLATGNAISVAQRTGPTVAIENISGNNAISDEISLSSGGTSFVGIQADAGTTLALSSGITCGVTGTRGVLLEGAGNGSVAGVIDNGSATTVSLTKDGSGTWTLNSANTYSGNTIITNGLLKLGASASLANTAVIEVDTNGTLDATLPGGLTLGSGQVLRGGGAVLGNVGTSGGSIIQAGITNQFGQRLALSNNLVFAGGDTIQYNFTTSPNNVLNVAGSLTLNGATTIQIFLPTGVAGNGTFRLINYTGSLLGGGSFALSAPVTSQTFALDTSTPGQVNLVITGSPQNLVWSGDGSGNVWDVAGTPNWTGLYFNQGDNVTFNDSGSATPDINVSVAVTPGTVTVSNTAEAYTFDGSGISTSYLLDKRGTNVLALTSSGNNFSGPILIEAGTLSLGNGGSTGSLGSGPVTNNGQLLLNLSSGGIGVSGAISGTGTIRLTGGGGALVVSGSNSYTGLTTIESGCQLNIQNNNALGSTNAGTVVQAGGSARFTSFGNWTVAEPLTINGYGLAVSAGALYANTTSNQVAWTGPITVGSPSQIRIVNNNVLMTLANSVTGNQQALQCSEVNAGDILTFQNTLSLGNDPVLAALTNDGVGTIVLAGNSNLCGSVTMNGGTFEITTTNAPQLGDITVNSGTLQLGSGLANGSMPPGTIDLAGSTTKLAINSSNSFVLNNQLSGAGSLSLINYGILTITSSNTFTGNVTTGAGTPVFGGTLVLSNSYALGDGTAAKTVTLIHASAQLEGGIDIPEAISFVTSSGNTPSDTNAGVTQVIRNLSGNNTIEGSITPGSGAGNSEINVASGLLTLNGAVSPSVTGRIVILSGAGNGVLNGALNDNGANVPALTKQGTGKWTLNNANVYSGVTVVQNGTLALGAGATIASTPSIQLKNPATLDVSGVSGGFTLGAAQTLAGTGNITGSFNVTGTVSPGPLGTLTFSSNLTLSGTTLMELNRTNVQNADLISAATLAYGGTLTVTNLGDALQAGDTFHLFSGTISGAFAVTNLPALSSTNQYWDVSQLASGIIKVGANVPPTPFITSPAVSGTNFTLQVAASQSGFNYVLQATPTLAPAVWTGVQTNAGTGGTLNFTFPITPGNPQQFFRISAQ